MPIGIAQLQKRLPPVYPNLLHHNPAPPPLPWEHQCPLRSLVLLQHPLVLPLDPTQQGKNRIYLHACLNPEALTLTWVNVDKHCATIMTVLQILMLKNVLCAGVNFCSSCLFLFNIFLNKVTQNFIASTFFCAKKTNSWAHFCYHVKSFEI